MALTREDVAAIAAEIAPGEVVTDADELAALSIDVFEWAEERPAQVAFRPADAAGVAAAIRFAAARGLSIAPRGGGLSYTRGFQPQDRPTALIDVHGLAGVRQLAADDRMVVVGAGTTWAELDEALKPHGLRPALEGPISGAIATIGGAVSQNMPAGLEHVLGLEIVLADGRIVKTGALAHPGSLGALRASGPDLTGLFVGDCGAFGIKTAVALRLASRPAAVEVASFGFADPVAMVEAMAEIQRHVRGLRVMGLAERSVRAAASGMGIGESLAVFRRSLAASGSLVGAARTAARLALGAARKTEIAWGLHLTAEAATPALAKAMIAAASRHVPATGIPIDPTVPLAMLSRFYSVRGMLGPKGERWAPVHGIFPLSKIGPATKAVQAFFAREAETMRSAGVTHSMMFAAQDTNVLVEPMLYWPDSLRAVHRRALRKDVVERFSANPERPDARVVARELRSALRDLLVGEGAVMAQLGRYYPYPAMVGDDTAALAASIKRLLDPENRINPGALGFDDAP
jgi:FAD/FMN-containing dehydrogenase